eukprot:1158368-Pelagomonas_calceolata.AAC.14
MNAPVLGRDLSRIKVGRPAWDRVHKDSIRAALVSVRGASTIRGSSIELSHRHITEPWSSARKATARWRSPDRILVTGVDKKMPTIGRSQWEALSLMHAVERQSPGQARGGRQPGGGPWIKSLWPGWIKRCPLSVGANGRLFP